MHEVRAGEMSNVIDFGRKSHRLWTGEFPMNISFSFSLLLLKNTWPTIQTT